MVSVNSMGSDKTLSIKVDINATLHGLHSGVLILVDGMSLTS